MLDKEKSGTSWEIVSCYIFILSHTEVYCI